jgi:hypothetical protein
MPPIIVLRVRAETRAALFGAGMFSTIEESVQPLLVYAHESGLIKQFGQSVIEAVILDAFRAHIQWN